jgi:hypothetical protein
VVWVCVKWYQSITFSVDHRKKRENCTVSSSGENKIWNHATKETQRETGGKSIHGRGDDKPLCDVRRYADNAEKSTLGW